MLTKCLHFIVSFDPGKSLNTQVSVMSWNSNPSLLTPEPGFFPLSQILNSKLVCVTANCPYLWTQLHPPIR